MPHLSKLTDRYCSLATSGPQSCQTKPNILDADNRIILPRACNEATPLIGSPSYALVLTA